MYEELIENLRFNTRQVRQYDLMILLFHAADAIEKLNRKVEDFEAVREISPEAEYAINKHTDNLISKLDELISDSDKSRWISVTKKLPNAYDLVLATDGEEIGFAAYQQKGNYWLGNEGFDIIYPEVTHWMPLPELPKD